MKGFILAGVAGALLCASGAMAADMPVKGPAMRAADPWSWSGFYVGAEGGWARMEHIVRDTASGTQTPTLHDNGGIAGGTIGVNWQNGMAVWGLEADYSWTNLHTQHNISANCAPAICDTKLSNFGTARGRLGITVTPTTMIYGTGGFAWGDVKSQLVTVPLSESKTQTGWTAGGGIEAMLTRNWTCKFEYLYADLGKGGTYTTGITFNQPQNVHVQVLRAGLNYKF